MRRLACSLNNVFLIAFIFFTIAIPQAYSQSTCPLAYSNNPDNNYAQTPSMGGPNLTVAILFIPQNDMRIAEIEVFTGESLGENTVSIWSHSSSLNRPDVKLSSGSWLMEQQNSWQGAELDSPVDLEAGSIYWLGWTPQAGAQASVMPIMANSGQLYFGSFNDGISWLGPFSGPEHHWKFRLYSSCEPHFIRGDLDDNLQLNLVDAAILLDQLFGNPRLPLECPDSADVNDDSSINLIDPIVLLNFLFVPNAAPPPAPQICGVDPTPDAIDCNIFGNCP